jgi:hypothetical protein
MLVFIAMLLGSCASLGPANLEKSVYYKNDMTLTINGKAFQGMAVAPKAKSYDIYALSQSEMDVISIQSCNREVEFNSNVSQGWFDPRKGFKYTYTPDSIEDVSSCPLHITGFDKDKGQHSWAFLDFQNLNQNLPAHMVCNGSTIDVVGVGTCQSHQGLRQEITFPVAVEIADTTLESRCKIPQSVDGKVWSFKIPDKECVLPFVEMDKPHRIFQLDLIGYEQIVIRGQ